MTVGAWHCGLCGQTSPECQCGDPLLLVIRIPGLTADLDEHDLAATDMVAMINAQRHENWVCGGGDPDNVKDVRLMASAWVGNRKLKQPVREDLCEPCELMYGLTRPAVDYVGMDDTPVCAFHQTNSWSTPPFTDDLPLPDATWSNEDGVRAAKARRKAEKAAKRQSREGA